MSGLLFALPFLPAEASSVASRVDTLFLFLIGVSAFFIILIFSLVGIFIIKYRKKKNAPLPSKKVKTIFLEVLWTGVPLAISIGIFIWAASLFYDMRTPPADALDIYVIGKQWMWKIYHPNGKEEINELHVPLGKAVKLTMTSKDVIHSLFIPAFRVKQDVLPGRYTHLWFKATEKGTYHLFCSQYCGTNHAQMTGNVVVVDPEAYQAWLKAESPAAATSAQPAIVPMAQRGQEIFNKFACHSCHQAGSFLRGPDLSGLYGSSVRLADGKTAVADAQYIRESILKPQDQLVAGYPAIMPTFTSLLSEDAVLSLVEYIKSLKSEKGHPQ